MTDQPAATTPASGLVFVLSGPSGVGKSTLIERLKSDRFAINYCVTATTRPRRAGEEHGTHYYFLSDAEYDQLLATDQFLEHAVVHNLYRYGIPLQSIRDGLQRGNDLIMAPDVQGASTVRWKLPNAITIFLRPPSLEAAKKSSRFCSPCMPPLSFIEPICAPDMVVSVSAALRSSSQAT